MPAIPDFDKMWEAYPVGTTDEVKTRIGGQVDNPLYKNTCAIRISHTLNFTGIPIPAGRSGLYTVKGGNNKWYALRQRELTTYVTSLFGKPTLHIKSPGDDLLYADRKGIISFIGIPGYLGGYGGHIDCWNGSSTQTGAYFNSSEVLLWEPVKLEGLQAPCKKQVNIRQGPGTTFDKAGRLMSGGYVLVEEQQGDWVRIGADRWVHKAYVDVPAPADPGSDSAGDGSSGEITAWQLNVRQGPGSGYPVVGTVTKGEQVTIYETSGSWLRIGDNRWVHNKYVQVAAGATAGAG